MPKKRLQNQATAVADDGGQTRREFVAANQPLVDERPPWTPRAFASHIKFHEEAVRRKLRRREWASIIVSRRRLIPQWEVDRILREGFVSRAV